MGIIAISLLKRWANELGIEDTCCLMLHANF